MSNSGNAVRFVRRLLGVTQAELARNLGVQQPTISRWERDGYFPWDHSDAVRTLVLKAGKPWQDAWFAVPPAELPKSVAA